MDVEQLAVGAETDDVPFAGLALVYLDVGLRGAEFPSKKSTTSGTISWSATPLRTITSRLWMITAPFMLRLSGRERTTDPGSCAA